MRHRAIRGTLLNADSGDTPGFDAVRLFTLHEKENTTKKVRCGIYCRGKPGDTYGTFPSGLSAWFQTVNETFR